MPLWVLLDSTVCSSCHHKACKPGLFTLLLLNHSGFLCNLNGSNCRCLKSSTAQSLAWSLLHPHFAHLCLDSTMKSEFVDLSSEMWPLVSPLCTALQPAGSFHSPDPSLSFCQTPLHSHPGCSLSPPSTKLHGARWLAEARRRQQRTNQRGPRWDFPMYFSGRLRPLLCVVCCRLRRHVESSWNHEAASSRWVTQPPFFFRIKRNVCAFLDGRSPPLRCCCCASCGLHMGVEMHGAEPGLSCRLVNGWINYSLSSHFILYLHLSCV